MKDHADVGKVSTQSRDRSLYYEVSSMEGSGDTCAVICITGPGGRHSPRAHTDAEVPPGFRICLDRCPELAHLTEGATSIRLFHLRTHEGEHCRFGPCEPRMNKSLSSR